MALSDTYYTFRPEVPINDLSGQSSASTTTSTSFVQAGYGKTATPIRTGRFLIIMTILLGNATAGDGAQAKLSIGTGSAPAAGATATGTVISPVAEVIRGAANANKTVTLFAAISGLTLGVAYWIDAQVAAITGGTANYQVLGCTVVEI